VLYRLREDALWRLEHGQLMVLDPRTRAARFYYADVSSAVNADGTVATSPDSRNLVADLLAMGVLEAVHRSGARGSRQPAGRSSSPGDPATPPDERAPPMHRALSAPLNVTIQVTNACNLACAHCHDPGAQVRHMDYDNFVRIVAELRAMRVFNVNLSGGEALLHKRILDMIRQVDSLGMKVTMSTNCTLVDEKRAASLRAAGLRQVHVSLDSHDPERHDAIRGVPGSFARMTRNLRHLSAAGLEYTLVTTLRGQSVEEYEQTVDSAFALGASAHKTNTLVPQGRGHLLSLPSFDLMQGYIEAFRKKQREYHGRFRLLAETMFLLQMRGGEPKAPRVLDVGCPAGHLTCAINERGDVMPCSFFTELKAGNAVQQGFGEVWRHSELFSHLRERGADRTCRSCDSSSTCGGCRARSYGIYGRLHEDDPYCSVGSRQIPPAARQPQPIVILRSPPGGWSHRVLRDTAPAWPGSGRPPGSDDPGWYPPRALT